MQSSSSPPPPYGFGEVRAGCMVEPTAGVASRTETYSVAAVAVPVAFGPRRRPELFHLDGGTGLTRPRLQKVWKQTQGSGTAELFRWEQFSSLVKTSRSIEKSVVIL